MMTCGVQEMATSTSFDRSGNLLTRRPHLIYLNSPWAVVVAPATGFGGFGGDFLVGQFGSGVMAQSSCTPSCQFVGLLLNPAVLQLQIESLWGLGFTNGSRSGPTTTLYFTAGAFEEAHGVFGSITCCTSSATQSLSRKRKSNP